MEYIIRIEDKKDSFTQTDKNIARYILENKDLIINQSSIDLAKNTNSSQAAVTRFVKKIGYNSFVDMKISIAKSFEEESNFIEDEIKKSDKIGDIISKSKANIQKTVEKTYALIDDEKIERACQFLNKTNKKLVTQLAINCLIASIDAKKYNNCRFLIKEISRLLDNELNYYEQTVFLYAQGYLEFAQGAHSGISKMRDALQIFNILNESSIKKQYEDHLSSLIDK
ncbi:MAG: hypothetical protein E7E32_02380 [Anaerococcus hydrogenalis]|nr:hypothetical protein [Anaerococcus hydrogenalis]